MVLLKDPLPSKTVATLNNVAFESNVLNVICMRIKCSMVEQKPANLRICSSQPFSEIKYYSSTRIRHQHYRIPRDNKILLESRPYSPVCRREPAHSPVAFPRLDAPDPVIVPQPQHCLLRGRLGVICGAWGAVLGGYGEDAVVGKKASVAVEEGAERRLMGDIGAIEIVPTRGSE